MTIADATRLWAAAHQLRQLDDALLAARARLASTTLEWSGLAAASAEHQMQQIQDHLRVAQLRVAALVLDRHAIELTTLDAAARVTSAQWARHQLASLALARLAPTRLPDPNDALPYLLTMLKQDGPPEDHFRVIETSTDPPTLIVLLAGVQDLSRSIDALNIRPTPNVGEAIREVIRRRNGTPRDLAVAIPQHVVGGGDYVSGVERELARFMAERRLPIGTRVVIVGHSHGAMTAIDLAARRSFNGDLVAVSHVIAAGGGQATNLNEPRFGTDVMVLTNGADAINALIAATDLTRTAYGGHDERFEHRRSVGIGADMGHDPSRYASLASALTARGRQFAAEAFGPVAGASAVITDIPLTDSARRTR